MTAIYRKQTQGRPATTNVAKDVHSCNTAKTVIERYRKILPNVNIIKVIGIYQNQKKKLFT